MIRKNLLRRLERLEDQMLPLTAEPLVLVIIGVDADGQRVEHCRFTIPAPPRAATKTRHR
jgi:hypothetical protein